MQEFGSPQQTDTHTDSIQSQSSTKHQAEAHESFNREKGDESAQLQKMADQYIDRKSPIQKKEQPNKTGLPDNLKTGIENLSGYSMDGVKVHYNSNKPAQLQAYAYAQGNQIHIAPGQEKHLPHEAWHVVQQKQGRVKPTRQLKSSIQINDDQQLEKEADVMGEKALKNETSHEDSTHQLRAKPSGNIVQRAIGFEFETSNPVFQADGALGGVKNVEFASGLGWKAVPDAGTVEFVTDPVDETQAGFDRMKLILDDLTRFALNMQTILNQLQKKEDGGLFSIFTKSHSDEETQIVTHPKTGTRPVAKVGYLSKGGFVAISPDMWIMRSRDGKVEAAPQITAGIKLDRIHDAIGAIVNNPEMRRIQNVEADAETQELITSARLARAASDQFLEDHPNSGGLNSGFIGMLTLLISYLRVPVLVARIEKGPANYPKDMPLLSRTNFAALALSSPQNKEEWDFLSDPEALFEAADLDGSINDYIFPNGYGTSNGVVTGPTRYQFLEGISRGIDVFSGSDEPGQASMGSMEMGGVAVDTEEHDRAILEFRRLKTRIPAEEWKNTVTNLFLKIHRINR